jgi:hypothetical protein
MVLEQAANLKQFRRGPFLGRLEGLDGRSGLIGWALKLQDDGQAPSLTLQLTLEDLLNPANRWKLAEVEANRARPDLRSEGLPADCGFIFLGHNGRDLPPRTSGLVVRVFFDTERTIELPGSPLRLDAESYQMLRQLCRTGLGRDACLGPVYGPLLAGWAIGAGPYQVRIDGGEPIAIAPPRAPARA